MYNNLKKSLALFATVLLTSISTTVAIDKLHFIIGGGAGGGWDGTARGTGGLQLKLVSKVRLMKICQVVVEEKLYHI